MRILLIEDDEVLRDILTRSLTEQRYVVDMAEDGQMGWQYAQEGTYDLLLIDVGLPRLDGISLCQRLRGEGYSTPILLMTGRDAAQERIRGLDAGADDYLTKPLDLGELQARVRALLRRGEVSPTSVLEIGALRLNPVSCEVTYNGQPLKLTPKEYSLLELFLRNPSRVFSRGHIVEHLWTFDDPPLEESVKAHIKGLRRRLKPVGAADLIENVYGLGYKLNPQAVIAMPHHPVEPIATSPETAQAELTPPETTLSETSAPAFEQALDKLWEQYQELMIERLNLLQTAADAVQTNTLTTETREAASKAAHKLAGVLGMFGREQGTQLARSLETILVDAPEKAIEIPGYVQQLRALLNLQPPATPMERSFPTAPAKLVLISDSLLLGSELSHLSQPAELSWQCCPTVNDAEQWIKTHNPELVVYQVGAATPIEPALPLLSQLADRTPAIPSIVITDTGTLCDRVQIAAAGVQGILSNPVQVTELWEMAQQLLQRSRTQSVNLLAVDDDPILLDALRPMLEPWGMRLTALNDPTRFWTMLNATRPDLLILDVEMPAFNGIELCQAVRTDPQWQDLPIVFLTAHRDAETVQQIFAAGADDYVSKPILGAELLTRITNRLERNHLLQTLSSRDSKTGLPNQPQSNRELEHLLQRAAIDQAPATFTVLTLVEIQQINVRYGHAVGNQVLKQWGDILRAAFRGGEVLGYWEHGEFVIGMTGLNKHQTQERLAPILTTLRQQIFASAEGDRFQVNYIVGIAEYPTEAKTVQALYRQSRQA